MDLSPEDHSPVEEVPVEQTRVYQNQPAYNQNQARDQTLPRPTPKTKSDSAVVQRTQLNQDVKKKRGQNRTKPNNMNQNWIDEDRRIPTRRPVTSAGFDGNGAIWVADITEQPGFLFPVARTTLSTIRRQITEEASLSVMSHEVPFFNLITVKACSFCYFNQEAKPQPRCLFCLQSGDLGQPDQAGESGFPSPQSDLYTPPVEGIHVTDVFYEDTVNSSPLETTTSAAAVSAATVMPGNHQLFCSAREKCKYCLNRMF